MDWKLALVQHPMYFLIKEDTICAERTPPWGEPNIERYIARVRDNLAMLRKYAQLKVGFEWSGLELELLAQDGPEVFEEMCALVKEGHTTFYNGTYAQPHLQTLSSEANYRQFEFGMRVYRDLCDYQVGVYAHQEASVHDQVPQLLKAFGIKFGVVPRFASTLAWLEEGELTLFAGTGLHFVQGHEFVAWRGLDGTEVPLYLTMDEPHGNQLEDFLARQALAGRLHVPPIILSVPDLIDVNEAWLEERKAFDLVLLDQALEERLQQTPPRARARFYTNWSYIEGIRAEELSRNTWRAEASALRAEALNALALVLVGRPAESTDCVWKTILSTQHHDVYCFCAPELRAKSVTWLQEAERDAMTLADGAAKAITDQVNTEGPTGQPVVVFGTVPHAQTALATVDVAIADAVVVDQKGETVPAEATPLSNGATRVRFVTGTPGLGYATYWVRSGGERMVEETADRPLSFENAFYRAALQLDGTFSSLALKPSGDELLDSSVLHGNQLAAMDSTGISPRREGPAQLANLGEYVPPEPGPQLHWEPDAAPRVRRSPLGMTLTVGGRMGSQVKADLTISLYNQLPRIDLSWTFTFDTASIGFFYDDDTKLRVHWPLAFAGDIYHDMAFGVLQTHEERPFFPASWVDVSDGKKGLAYFHQGTLKHWVTEGTLVNLFAWGEYTEAIGSRLWRHNWFKAFDQQLRGTHTIHSALYPHAGDWRSADVIGVARSFGAPPAVYKADRHSGELPPSQEVLSLRSEEVVSTAVKVEDAEIMCRVYSVGKETTPVRARTRGVQAAALRSLSGEPITQLEPFQIGRLTLHPEK